MTPLDLQEELVAEIIRIFDGHTYLKAPKNRLPVEYPGEGYPGDGYDMEEHPDGDEQADEEPDAPAQEQAEERVPLQVFSQDVPILETGSEEDPVPYVIVRLSDGSDDGGRDSENLVNLVIIIGIWDGGLKRTGYRDVMGIIQKIYMRFHRNPDLNRKAAYKGNFKWAIQNDAYQPYSFGACHVTFRIAAIRREDEFA